MVVSYESIASGGDETRKALLIKKESAFHYLTSKVLKEQQQQKLAAIHYGAANTWLLFAPTILITLASAVLSLLVQSPLVPSDYAKSMIALMITVFQLVLSLFQSISKQLNYGGKQGFHQSAASSLKKIYDQALYSIKAEKYQSIFTALKTNTLPSPVEEPKALAVFVAATAKQSQSDTNTDEEENKGDEENSKPTSGSSENKKGGDDKEPEKPKNTIENLNQQFHQAVAQVDSPVPMNIAAAFNMLESRINTVNKSLLRDKKSAKIAWEKVYPAAYYQLSETITQSKGWPLRIPNPTWSVDQTLKDFKRSLRVGDDNNGDLLNELVARAEAISKVGDKLKDHATKDHSAETKPKTPETELLLKSGGPGSTDPASTVV